MKTQFQKLVLASLCINMALFSCKKKEEKAEEPVVETPTPGTSYSTFASTIAIVDYTAPTSPSTKAYTVNLSPAATAMAYIEADGVRIDSLQLAITRVADMVAPPSVTWAPAPCDKEIYGTYIQNSKSFKLKAGSANSLRIYENGVFTSSVAILIKKSQTIYDIGNGYSVSLPYTYAGSCPDGIKYFLIQ